MGIKVLIITTVTTITEGENNQRIENLIQLN